MPSLIFVTWAAVAALSGPSMAKAEPSAEPVSIVSKQAGRAGGLRPGRHQCQLSAEYRVRPCTVTSAGAGRYRLVFPGGLMGIEGELVQRGARLVFTGRITEDEPFICASPERHLPDYARLAEACRSQTLTAILRRGRNGWVGTLAGLRELNAVYANDRPAGQPQTPLSHRLVPYAQTAIPLTILH